METQLNPKDLEKYSFAEVASLVDVDRYAVRDEGMRRQSLAEKKLAKLNRQIEVAKEELRQAQEILKVSL